MEQAYILKIVKGECTSEERAHFFAQVVADKELAGEYARVKNNYMIEQLPYCPDAATTFFTKKPTRRLSFHLMRIAATLFIPLLAYTLYNFFTGNKIAAGGFKTIASYETATGVRYWVNTGVKAVVTLPDSTQVWLNSGSSLDVPNDFGKDNRLVFFSGEGYFKVQSDTASPFLIKIPQDMVVRVTGTEFNLSCYENDRNLKLTLMSGSLELIREKSNEIINVRPNEQVVIDYKSLDKEQNTITDTGYATAWKEGYLRFDNTPMDDVVRRLERWYGVHISVEDRTIYKHLFTADFESESICQVLDMIETAVGIAYEVDGNKVRLYTVSQ